MFARNHYMNIEDKVAIVTGSSMGIGKAIARQLGREGARVVLNGRDPVKLSDTCSQLKKEGLKVCHCPGDISKVEDCIQLVEHALENFGSIDILVNNASLSSKGFFADTQPEVFQQIVETNILGSSYITHAALPHLKISSGQILFISSLAGLRGIPFQSPYCLTKTAQVSLAEALRVELSPEGVHVGIFFAGITKNDPRKKIVFSDGSWRNLPDRTHQFVFSQLQTAQRALFALRRKRFKTTIGLSGMIYYFLARHMPWVLDYFFKNHIQKIIALDVPEKSKEPVTNVAKQLAHI